MESNFISHLHLDVGENDHPIPLPNVSASVLKKVPAYRKKLACMWSHVPILKVLEYCEHHRGEPIPTTDADSSDDTRKRTTDIGEWDQRFISVDQEMLFEIILAANYLDIKSLLYVDVRTSLVLILTLVYQ